ncbi:MAG: O-antigen ligase family protein [Verrucomicrobiota bacterium]
MSFQTSAAAWEPPSPAEHRSGIVFGVMLLLVLLAVAFPEMAPQVLQGILWSGAGVLVMLLPPEVRVPRMWLWLAAGFVGFSLVGFLPRQWFGVAPWRHDLDALGLDTGPYGFVQPGLALETLAGFAVSAVVGVFLLGHRVVSRTHYRLAFGFVLGVAMWTLAALCWYHENATFGFFPNRNHTATLLAMGSLAGLGCFAQAIRLKAPWKIAGSLVPTCLFLWVLLKVSESRAGVVLVGAGFLVWLVLAGLRHLRGHVGKAIILLLIALAGMFLIVDSKVKTRFEDEFGKNTLKTRLDEVDSLLSRPGVLDEAAEKSLAPLLKETRVSLRASVSLNESVKRQIEARLNEVVSLLNKPGALDESVEKEIEARVRAVNLMLEPAAPSDAAPKLAFDEGSTVQPDIKMDGRIAIYHDTWSMIRRENWSGVGPGQFARVFPQYRKITNAANEFQCFHPESDWLWMLAETGWLATLCLAAGMVAVLFTAFKQVRSGRTRFLRAGGLVAALLLCLHGIFDVPGHRVGLMWAALLLAAMSLRAPEEGNSAVVRDPSRVSRFIWRCLGGVLVLAGGGLLVAAWSGSPVLPSARALRWMEETKTLYDADQTAYDRAKADGHDYQPPPGQDPLESAITRVERVLRISPLDPHRQYILGALALHFDDKRDEATRAFAIQRRLDPTRVNSVLMQARAWTVQDPQQTKELWTEALRRAAADEGRFPTSSAGTNATYQEIMRDVGKKEPLATVALELATGKPPLLLIWARSAPAALVDREMPRLLAESDVPAERTALFQAWKTYGSKGAAADFAREHPELEPAPRPAGNTPKPGQSAPPKSNP